jgi:hypothetical protein
VPEYYQMVASKLGRCGLETSISAHVLAIETRRTSCLRTSGLGVIQKEEELNGELCVIRR